MVGITTVVVTALTGYGVNKSMNNSNAELSDLTLANLEALAENEEGENGTSPCLKSYHYQHNYERSISGAEVCYNDRGETCGNQEICEYTSKVGSSCTEHFCE